MAIGYFNGKIIGQPSDVYDELVNRDISELPHTKRMDDTGFFYVKRKSYRGLRNKTGGLKDFSKWIITDYIIEDFGSCSNVGSIDSVRYGYAYLVNQDRTQYAIIGDDPDNCSITEPKLLEQGNRCICSDDKFSRILWNTGTYTGSDHNVGSRIYNANTYGYVDIPNTVDSISTLSPGDYVVISSLLPGSSGVCGQIRQIISVKEYSGKGNYYKTLQLSQPRTGIGSGSYDGVIIRGSKEISNAIAFVSKGGIRVMSKYVDQGTICDYAENSCILSMENHNGSLTYLNDKGYNFYGGVGFDTNSISASNSNNVGNDKIDSVSFNNFLVFFGRNSVSTAVFSEDGKSSFYYDLDRVIGIHNKGAYALFDDGLYFVGSDNRIYGASIVANGNNFLLKKEDITKNILGHMKLVQPDDDIYISSYGDRLYVFINGRQDYRSSDTDKTKILIYDKTYGQWLVHTIGGMVITGNKYGLFLGDNIFKYCGWDGDGYGSIRKQYEARAEAIIYKNNDHGIKDSSGLPLDMFRKHELLSGVILLGMGKYTSESTYVKVDRYDKYRLSKAYPISEDNTVIQNWYRVYNGERVEPDDCFKKSLSGYDNVKNECQGSANNYKVKDDCIACTDRRIFDDYSICYDDNAYQLSPVHKFSLTFNEPKADYFRVSFICGGYDIGYFGGMILTTRSENSFNVDTDSFTSGCSEKILYCNSEC